MDGWKLFVSDNGPCYTSERFTILMKDYNVNHITSSPHYPQSNGLAEKICAHCEEPVFSRQRRKVQTYTSA